MMTADKFTPSRQAPIKSRIRLSLASNSKAKKKNGSSKLFDCGLVANERGPLIAPCRSWFSNKELPWHFALLNEHCTLSASQGLHEVQAYSMAIASLYWHWLRGRTSNAGSSAALLSSWCRASYLP